MLWSVANMLWPVANRPQLQRTLAAWRCASPLWAREQSLRHLPMIFRGGSHEASYPRVVYVQYIQYCTNACVLYTSVSMNNVALSFSQLESKLERVVLALCLRGSPLPGCRAPAAGARGGSVLAAGARPAERGPAGNRSSVLPLLFFWWCCWYCSSFAQQPLLCPGCCRHGPSRAVLPFHPPATRGHGKPRGDTVSVIVIEVGRHKT